MYNVLMEDCLFMNMNQNATSIIQFIEPSKEWSKKNQRKEKTSFDSSCCSNVILSPKQTLAEMTCTKTWKETTDMMSLI